MARLLALSAVLVAASSAVPAASGITRSAVARTSASSRATPARAASVGSAVRRGAASAQGQRRSLHAGLEARRTVEAASSDRSVDAPELDDLAACAAFRSSPAPARALVAGEPPAVIAPGRPALPLLAVAPKTSPPLAPRPRSSL